MVNTDLGFIEKGNMNLGTRITTNQKCVQSGVPHIWPFRAKDKKALSYEDQTIHRVRIVDNIGEDPVWSDNSARFSTFSMKNRYQIMQCLLLSSVLLANNYVSIILVSTQAAGWILALTGMTCPLPMYYLQLPVVSQTDGCRV